MSGTAAALRPLPVRFGDCFGWYHPAAPGHACSRGVVFCAPFGVEELWTHRNLRHLATMAAAAGLPVIRFDYPATGDSPGGERPGLLERWLDAIAAASDFIQQQAQVQEVALCGVRLGGLLAAEALRRRPGAYQRLALLAPVVAGAAYARELQLWGCLRSQPRRDAEWVEVAGFSLHASDIRRLCALNLKDALSQAPPSALLVFDIAANRLDDDAWRARLAADGTLLTVAHFAGYAEFMREAYLAEAPLAEFERVVAFLRSGARRSGDIKVSPELSRTCRTLDDGTIVESSIMFGHAQDLFGILCHASPARARVERARPAVVILNSGSSHRIGDARYAVLLTRRLAAQGIASLRLDLGGIGDSPRSDDPNLLGGGPDAYRRAWLRLYARSRNPDVRAALDALESKGHAPFILLGLCSGAHAAFRAALVDPRVAGIVLTNLPSFGRVSATDATSRPNAANRPRGIPFAYRVARAVVGRRTRWRLQHAAELVYTSFEQVFGRTLSAVAGRIGVGEAAWAERALRGLSVRGVRVLLLYSRGDPGFANLEACFGPEGRRLSGIPNARCAVLDGCDHGFSSADMRDRLIARVEQGIRAASSGMEPVRLVSVDLECTADTE